MSSSDLCESNKAIGLEVKDFIENVHDVKEESITDYLMWKWRKLDRKFNYIRTSTFTRQEESKTTGADFELELWIVGRIKSIPLLFQAKKFLKPHDGYKQKLNYPHNTQKQLQTLLSYAKAHALLPFYAIYTAKASTSPLCRKRQHFETGLYMMEADKIRAFADGKYGTRISLDNLIACSNPFHCLFCCPLSTTGDYLERYFYEQTEGSRLYSTEILPDYVRELISLGRENVSPERLRINSSLPPSRFVAVYDLDNEPSFLTAETATIQ